MRKRDYTLYLGKVAVGTVFREVLKMRPQWERAVRLRLQRLTCAKIAEAMNAEKQPGEEDVGTRWVNLRCRRAFNVLSRFCRREELLWQKKPDRPQSHLYAPTEMLRCILADQMNRDYSLNEFEDAATDWRKIYPCRFCNQDNWTHTYKNMGSHRNVRIYACGYCHTSYTAAERSKLMQQFPR